MRQKQSIIRPLPTTCRALAALAVFAPLAQHAQQTDPATYSIVQNGPHSRVWQRVSAQSKTTSYTELATGLNHLVNGQWVESSETIQITPDGAAATNGQHQVYFPANINTSGGIHLVTPDGQDMRSDIVGLAYFDSATSNSVMIGELQDSTGELLPSQNQILYTNAFNGVDADVRYTYTKAGMEQDVILRTQLPPPGNWNLNPHTTLLQVWTEFTAAPTPQIYCPTNSGDSLTDEWLNFGTMQMGRGKAFILGNQSDSSPVFKQWQVIQGQTFLVESVELDAISSQLQNLPSPNSPGDSNPGSSGSSSNGGHSMLHHLSNRTALLAQKHINKPASPMPIASKQPEAKGLVLDYITINSTQTNFTFQSDTTYYISSSVSFSTITAFEGGTVVKYNTNTSLTFTAFGTPINWFSANYRPVILTAKDDNSVGSVITNPTNVPSGYYASEALSFFSSPGSVTFKHFRISYAATAIATDFVSLNLYDGQILNCQYGIAAPSSGLSIYNLLFANVGTDLVGNGGSAYAQNVTFSNSTYLESGLTFTLTNCILANVSNLNNSLAGSYFGYGNFNCFYNTPSNWFFGSFTNTAVNPFQTIGAGDYYLTTSNSFRNVGSTNIDPVLLADLRQKTTYPPSSLTVDFSDPKNESPYALRDNGTNVDLGYHYDPIDWALGGIEVVGPGSLVFQPGTVVALYCNTNSDNTNFGLTVGSGGYFSCLGTANALCRIVNYNTVQEQSGTNWNTPAQGLIFANTSTSTNNYRFTDFSVMAQDTAFIYNTNGTTVPITLQDCQLHGGLLYSTNATINLLNCLLERVTATLWALDGNAPQIRNNLFGYGNLDLIFTPSTTLIQNNFFDHNTNTDHGLTNYIGTYNAYVIGCDHLTLTNATNDQFLASPPSYQATAQGNYYLPSGCQLINKGSTTADVLGLYLYCTTTNELAETNSQVDIGYHYVALNPTGVPTNTDPIPDLLYYKMTEYVPTTLPTGLPTYTNYSLTLTDSSTNGGATGTVSSTGGNPILWRSNKTGFYTGAIHWRESVLTVADTNRFNFGTNLFTINFWVQPLTGADSSARSNCTGCPMGIPCDPACYNIALLGNGSADFSNGWWIVQGGAQTAVIGANIPGFLGDYTVTTGNGLVPVNMWTMLTFVRPDTNTISIYVNGQLDITTNFPIPAPSTNNLVVGRYTLNAELQSNNLVVTPFDGDFGVIRIYSTNLMSNQIYQLWMNGTNGLVR
jgi:hypothetical protein